MVTGWSGICRHAPSPTSSQAWKGCLKIGKVFCLHFSDAMMKWIDGGSENCLA